MIVDSALYHDGSRVTLDSAKDDLAALRSAPRADGDFVWIGLHEPTSRELESVAQLFHLHPLAVTAALEARQRPKLERYDESLFMVLKTLLYVEELDAVETGQVSLFLGRDFVVTVRHGTGAELHSARLDLEKQAKALGHGPWAVLHAVCDQIVDGYERVAAALEEDVNEVEASVFSPERSNDAARIYAVKRELAEMRRALAPLKDPIHRFASGVVPDVPSETAAFFRDVADQVVRVSEAVDHLDGLLSTAFEAHVARIGIQQNNDMRKISAWVAIGAASTLVVGFFGMNFVHLPATELRYGYLAAVALMLVASLVLYRLFKRSGWL